MTTIKQPGYKHPNLIKYLQAEELVDALDKVFTLSGELGWDLDFNLEEICPKLSAYCREIEEKIYVLD